MNTVLIVELSLVDLEKLAIDNVPTKQRQYATDEVTFPGVEFFPDLTNNKLRVKALTTGRGRKYDTNIVFNDVIFTKSGEGIELPTSEPVNIRTISSNADVQVSCNCLDFRFRWSIWNQSKDALYGKPPPPYKRKTDRAPVNPKKSPGICKHLMKLSQYLINRNIIS